MEGERVQSRGAVSGTLGGTGAQGDPLTTRVKSASKDVRAEGGLSGSPGLADLSHSTESLLGGPQHVPSLQATRASRPRVQRVVRSGPQGPGGSFASDHLYPGAALTCQGTLGYVSDRHFTFPELKPLLCDLQRLAPPLCRFSDPQNGGDSWSGRALWGLHERTREALRPVPGTGRILVC